MGLFDEPITYEYYCIDCDRSFQKTATFAEHAEFEPTCDECGQKMCFKAVDYNPHATNDMHGEPKTLGALAEKNSKQREKEGKSIEHPHKRYNKKILDNPEKYIMTGKV